ncbi:MAG TPA: nuclear transport factor 2 family protein [Acidobacteriaceae bacterium]|nr:nuclear transport factor 2 family protein [Acidobacteriaceae bacterium]
MVQTLRALYTGASKDDYRMFRSVLAPDFHAFDGGVDYPGVAVLDYVKKNFQDKGYVFVWTVVNPTVHTVCNMAWITYTNIGSLADPAGKHVPLKWLESAVLQKEHGRWLIRFFDSALTPGSQERLRTFLMSPPLPATESAPHR